MILLYGSVTRLGIVIVILTIIGCASAPENTAWSNSNSWRKAAASSVSDVYTWAPLGGAAVLQIADLDQDLSSWTTQHTPVFGSRGKAIDASGQLLDLSRLGMVTTALLVPSKQSGKQSTAGRLVVQAGAVVTTDIVTQQLKRMTDRQRPDLSANNSFPSGHSSGAFAFSALSSRNTDKMEIKGSYKQGLAIFFRGLAAGSAWARVEAGRHYPSDVLVGAAMGNFIASTINDAVLDNDTYSTITYDTFQSNYVLTVVHHF